MEISGKNKDLLKKKIKELQNAIAREKKLREKEEKQREKEEKAQAKLRKKEASKNKWLSFLLKEIFRLAIYTLVEKHSWQVMYIFKHFLSCLQTGRDRQRFGMRPVEIR